MEINVKLIVEHEIYNILEKYAKENKIGLAYIYLIMNAETYNILCKEDSNMFYGVAIAIDNNLESWKIKIIKNK